MYYVGLQEEASRRVLVLLACLYMTSTCEQKIRSRWTSLIFFLFRWVRNRGSGTNLCTDLLFSHSASIFMFPEKDNRNAPTPSDQELLEGKERLEARENPL
jgi:hypothetical protein